MIERTLLAKWFGYCINAGLWADIVGIILLSLNITFPDALNLPSTLSSEKAADWAQAIVSACAVIAALFIPHHTMRKERLNQLRDRDNDNFQDALAAAQKAWVLVHYIYMPLLRVRSDVADRIKLLKALADSPEASREETIKRLGPMEIHIPTQFEAVRSDIHIIGPALAVGIVQAVSFIQMYNSRSEDLRRALQTHRWSDTQHLIAVMLAPLYSSSEILNGDTWRALELCFNGEHIAKVKKMKAEREDQFEQGAIPPSFKNVE